MDINDLENYIIKRGCVKCKYQWFPRSANTKRCPRCQTWIWHNTEEEERLAEENKE